MRDANLVAEWLKSRGVDVEAYTGDTGERRPVLEDALLQNRLKALVATTALGMGFDKPDLSFVVHYQAPGSVVAYYQQVGRAGRAIDVARGVLLSGKEETDITDYFIETAFPTRAEVRAVLGALDQAPEGLSIPDLMGAVNVRKGRIEKTVQLLSLEAPPPIVKVGSKWQLTAAALDAGFWERADRLTTLRREEQAQMQEYVSLGSGHMEFLIRALDGNPAELLVPSLPPLSASVDQATAEDAVRFLRRTSLPIEPRKRWPAGGMPRYGVSGVIGTTVQAQAGKALCIWGDAGWGAAVRRGKYVEGRFDDELVEASAQLIRSLSPQPPPTWVTCMPSTRHPDLVPDFARRLAGVLGLPFEPVLVTVGERPEQKTMANGTQQARNVDGVLTVVGDSLRNEPVLLVDDMVDSKWTLTVGAWLLRSHGSGEVWPFALAQAGAGND